MKVGFCIVLLCILGSPGGVSRAAGLHFLHGEILNVDHAARVMLVRVVEDAERSRVVRVIMPQALLSKSPDGTPSAPACLSSGKQVRIWGDEVPHEAGEFVAAEIRGCGMASCADPTGVRSRLSRKRENP